MWLGLWLGGLAVSLVGVVFTMNGLRFGRRVARERRELWAAAGEARVIDRARFEDLPAPVRRYFARVIRARQRTVRTAHLSHGGTFRPRLDGAWLPIHGEQYFTADPPGFLWWGRVRILPGLWIDARDRSANGIGGMLVSAESTFTLADSSGPQLDQGALLRLLGELTWLPTSLVSGRHVTWAAIDDKRAAATLRLAGHEVTGVFTFGDDDLAASFNAERYRDLGGGRSVLTPFSADVADYREVDGLLVPHEVVAYWHVDGRSIPYVRFLVERIEYDVASTD